MYIRAWLERHEHGVEALFVAAAAPERAPATRSFADEVAARAWVECEARQLCTRVEWLVR